MTKIKTIFIKTIAIISLFCMVFSMIPSVIYADTSAIRENVEIFSDVNGHWASKSINKWAELGLLKGDEKGFRPNDFIKRAEMASILNNLMGYQVKANNNFHDLNGDEWYADSILKANNAGILKGDGAGYANPKANISREEAALMLGRAFVVNSGNEDKTSFKDAKNISSWAKDLVFGMEACKYIGGMGNGNFEPKSKVTRAQVVTMIDNAVKAYYTVPGTYTENIAPEKSDANCLVIVKTEGVNLKNCKISGDLIIAEGVGDGEFTLDGTKVTGKLTVRGGGVNSIYIINGSEVNGNVSVDRKDGVTRIVSNGVTIATLSANTEVVLEGKFSNINVAEGAEVEVKGQVDNIILESKANVTVSKNAEVKSLTVAESAEGSNVNISGSVGYLKTNAANTEIMANSSAKIQTIEAMETALGTNVSIDKNASIKTFNSLADVTTSGDGKVEKITGTGSITNKETGKKVEEKPYSDGGSSKGTSPVTLAERAINAYENAPITSLDQIAVAEGLKVQADASLLAITDETQKTAFELRITTRAGVIAEEKIKLQAVEAAEVLYEAAKITTLTEVADAEALEITANEKVALVVTGSAKTGLENRIAAKKILVEAAKADLNATKDSDAYKTEQATILSKTVDIIAISDKQAVNVALEAYNNLSPAAKAKLTVEKTLLDNLLVKIGVLEAEELERLKVEAAELAVSAYEAALITTLTEVSQAEALEITANEKVALVAVGSVKTELENRIANKKALVDGAKADLNATKDSDAYKTEQATILSKTVETIAISDKEAVNMAVTAYNNLSTQAKAKLTVEKTLLDNLLVKIEELQVEAEELERLKVEAAQLAVSAYEAASTTTLSEVAQAEALEITANEKVALVATGSAKTDLENRIATKKILVVAAKADLNATKDSDAYKTEQATILSKTVETIAISDKEAVNVALEAYNNLSPAAKAKLTVEKTLLDNLLVKIGVLEAEELERLKVEAAELAVSAYEAALITTLTEVSQAEELEITANEKVALVAVGSVKTELENRIANKKALVDGAKADLNATKDSDAYRTEQATILSKTVETIAISDKQAVNVALEAYNNLSPAAKAKLTVEKTLLDNLLVKIGVLEAEELERLKVEAAELAVSAYEAAKITTLTEVSQAEALEITANEKVALVEVGSAKTGLENRIANKKALVDGAKADLNAIKDSEAFKVAQAIILGKTTETILITDKDAVNEAIAAYNNLSEAAKLKLNTEKALLDSLLVKIGVLEAVLELQVAKDKANDLDDLEFDYTRDSWINLQNALVEPESTYQEIVLKIKAINTAIVGLRFLVQEKLDIAIETISNLNKSDYSAELWSAIETSIAMPETTNVEVNKKTKAINLAIKNLGVVTAESLGATIDKLGPGIYNIMFSKNSVKLNFIGIDNQKLILTFDGGKVEEAIYVENLKIGAGWVAYDIQGTGEETKLKAAIVTMAD